MTLTDRGADRVKNAGVSVCWCCGLRDVRGFVDPLSVKPLACWLASVDACLVYVQGFKYVPELFEKWSRPAETVGRGYGDCEDLSILLCSLLRALGVKAYVRVAVVNGRIHAFNVFHYYGRWWVFDASIKKPISYYPVYELIMDFNESELYVYDEEKYRGVVSRIF